MSKKQKLFILISISFFLLIALGVWDMARKTTSPWKRKQMIQQMPESKN